MDVCRLSYNNIYTYDIDNQNVGILLAYSSNDVEKLDKPMLEHLRRKNIFLDSFEKECFEDEFYIDTVSVSPSFQGRGIAKELFSFAEQKAKELGFKKLSLLVDFENLHHLILKYRHSTNPYIPDAACNNQVPFHSLSSNYKFDRVFSRYQVVLL